MERRRWVAVSSPCRSSCSIANVSYLQSLSFLTTLLFFTRALISSFLPPPKLELTLGSLSLHSVCDELWVCADRKVEKFYGDGECSLLSLRCEPELTRASIAVTEYKNIIVRPLSALFLSYIADPSLCRSTTPRTSPRSRSRLPRCVCCNEASPLARPSSESGRA